MKVSLFAFGVLFACVCTVAQADFVDFLSVGDGPSNLRDTLAGLAAAVGGSINTDNIYNCGFAAIADNLVGSINDLIIEASGCNPGKISDIQAKLQALLASIPQSIGACLQLSTDAQALLNGLHVNGKSPQQIQDTVTSYITNNPLTACWDLQGLAGDINNGNYKQFGTDGGAILIKVFASKKNVSTLRASKEHLTQVLAGIATSVQDSVDVNSIASCSDEPTFATIEAALLPLMDEAASCDPTKLDDIAQKVTTLVNGLPDSAKQCLNTNAEGQKLLKGLGILGLTPDQIKSKITSYVLGHIFSLCGTIGNLNKKLKGGDFNGFGTDVGKLALEVFKTSMKSSKQIAQETVLALRLSASKDHLTQVLAGISTSVQDKVDVNSIASCGDEPTFASIEAALLPIMDEAASCDPTKLEDIAQKVTAVVKALPVSSQECLKTNAEGQKLLKGLGILGLTPDQIKSKITSYVLGHILSLCGTLGNLNKKLKGGDYNGFGTDVGKLALEVFKSAKKSDKKIAQEAVFALLVSDKVKLSGLESFGALLGGVASVVAKGADTQTTAKCTDEPTAGNVISTIAELVKKGSTCDLTKAAELATKAKALIDSIPAGHKQCFTNDPAAKQLATGLGIVGTGIDKIVQKVLVYAIGHFSDVCNSVKVLDSSSSSSNWNQFGVDSAKLLQRMLA